MQGIYTYQSGFPIGFGNIIFTGDLDDIALSGGEQSLTRWFNTDAGFNRVPAQQLVSNVRTFPLRLDSVRSDTVNNVDLSVIKNAIWPAAGSCSSGSRRSTRSTTRCSRAGRNTDPDRGAFGTISASTQQNYARRMQVMVKFLF